MEYNIINSVLTTNYEYKDTGIIITGRFVKDAVTGILTGINGTCFRNVDGEQGESFGSFTGFPQDNGKVLYDLSQMSREDSNLVWDAIDNIEAQVLPVE